MWSRLTGASVLVIAVALVAAACGVGSETEVSVLPVGTLTLSVGESEVPEDVGAIPVKLTATTAGSEPPVAAFTVAVKQSDWDANTWDFKIPSPRVTFSTADFLPTTVDETQRYRATKTVMVNILDDPMIEDTERFDLTVDARGASSFRPDDPVTIVIVDGDTFGLDVTVSPGLVVEGSTTDVAVTIAVTSKGASAKLQCVVPFPFSFALSVDGTAGERDYRVLSGAFDGQFAPCEPETTLTLRIAAMADAITETNGETIEFTATASNLNDDPLAVFDHASVAVLTIKDESHSG